MASTCQLKAQHTSPNCLSCGTILIDTEATLLLWVAARSDAYLPIEQVQDRASSWDHRQSLFILLLLLLITQKDPEILHETCSKMFPEFCPNQYPFNDTGDNVISFLSNLCAPFYDHGNTVVCSTNRVALQSAKLIGLRRTCLKSSTVSLTNDGIVCYTDHRCCWGSSASMATLVTLCPRHDPDFLAPVLARWTSHSRHLLSSCQHLSVYFRSGKLIYRSHPIT